MAPAYEKPLKMLSETDPSIKIKGLRELGRLKASECLSDILRLLDDSNDDVRVESAIAIGKIGNPAVADDLLKYLKSNDVPILMEVINTLGILGANGYTKAASAIEFGLDHSNFRVRKFTIQALALCGTSDSIEKLYAIFEKKESSIETKEAIALAIGQIGGSRAIEILKDLASEGIMEIRRAAIKSLGEMRTTVSLEVLGKVYNDKKEEKIIKKFAEEGIQKVIEGAKDSYLKIKQRAEEILKGKE